MYSSLRLASYGVNVGSVETERGLGAGALLWAVSFVAVSVVLALLGAAVLAVVAFAVFAGAFFGLAGAFFTGAFFAVGLAFAGAFFAAGFLEGAFFAVAVFLAGAFFALAFGLALLAVSDGSAFDFEEAALLTFAFALLLLAAFALGFAWAFVEALGLAAVLVLAFVAALDLAAVLALVFVVALDLAAVLALVFVVALDLAAVLALGLAFVLAVALGFVLATALFVADTFFFAGAFCLAAAFFLAVAFSAVAFDVPAGLRFAAMSSSVTKTVFKKWREPYQIEFDSPSEFKLAENRGFLRYYQTFETGNAGLQVARRLEQIQPFRVMELLARANELAAAGHDVIHLEVGEPDFETPAPVVVAARHALDRGETKYTEARGNLALREAIAEYYRSQLNVTVAPERVFVTAGASGGLLLLTALLTNPGDNLLMADPGYPCNRHFLSSFDAEGLLVPVAAEDNYQLTPAHLESFWNDRTRGALVASPANPTGAVLSQAEYLALADAIRARQGIFLVDEIYQGLVYEEQQTATVLKVADDAFVVNSFSKYFGMTGWRLGWLVVPEAVTRDLEKLAQNLFICPSAIAQAAAMAAFSEDALKVMEAQRSEFEARRDFLVPALRSLGFSIPRIPAGAFYVYAGLPAGQEDAESFCSDLLEEEFVAITPGTDFGFHDAWHQVRISYARDIHQLEQAMTRLGRFLEQRKAS